MSKLKPLFILIVLAAAAYAAMTYLKSSQNIKVIYLKGKAFVDDSSQTPVKQGDTIPTGMSVNLGKNSKCFLQMSSGGVIKLNSETSVVINENKNVELQKGSLEYNSESGSSTINTSHGDIIVSEGHVNISLKDNKTYVSVFSGSAEVVKDGESILVEEEQGISIDDATTGEVVNLPQAPTVRSPNDATNIEQIPFDVVSERMSYAKLYYWECAVDDTFNLFLFEDALTDAKGKLHSHPHEDGGYYLRVRVENKDGFLSPFSDPVSFSLKAYKKINKHRSFAKNFYLNKKYQKTIEEANLGLAISTNDIELLKYLSLTYIVTKKLDDAYKTAKVLKSLDNARSNSALQEIVQEWKRSAKDSRWKKLSD